MVEWTSEELARALAELTAQQAAGVVRIVQAELEGRSLTSLLESDDRICASTTYYGRGGKPGWNGKPAFQRALKLARRDYREWLLMHGTGETLAILAQTSPEAARLLRHQVVGDEAALAVLETCLQAREAELRMSAARRLGATGLPRAVAALRAALQREKNDQVRNVLVEALGSIAGGADRDRSAAESVLDRAAVETAAKRAFVVDEADVDAAIERELARLAGDGEGAASGAAADDASAEAL
jgi:hypothetical protein